MLASLSVSNIVLIEQLTLDFEPGLTVLTGETGAGKSILLDALGLALGSRADFGLIRQGSKQAQVSAIFNLSRASTLWGLVDEAGISSEDQLILRRRLKSDGKSSASINDVPVSVGLLRQVGDMLVEIQGQFEGRGLLDTSTHVALLDRVAGHQKRLSELRQSWHSWADARSELEQARQALNNAKSEEDWLRDAVEVLDQLAPQTGEEDSLITERTRLANLSKIGEGIAQADDALFGDAGAQNALGTAINAIEKAAELAGGPLDETLAALQRAEAEFAEASSLIHATSDSLEASPKQLEQIDDRLHALRQQARKHNCDINDLPQTHQKLAARLSGIEDQSGQIGALQNAAEQWQDSYQTLAAVIDDGRRNAARTLDTAVAAELPPLKLDGAIFQTVVSQLDKSQWGPNGTSLVRFEASTNKGMAPGPIDKIASGGELARFLLALKVVLESSNDPRTLIFDEVDSGVGGAVAAAVGERLARLGQTVQTLVITHSPQVAAKGTHHLRIYKTASDDTVISGTETLSMAQRTEEIARMLAGETITAEARAAATALLGT
jgi:DNA repair protein RecN (Recombination protein N)